MTRLPLLALVLVPARLLGQNSASDGHSPAATYLERYQQVSNLAPLPGRVAEVSHLVLSRDVGRLTLERGTLYLLGPVGGRTVGALFRGEGRFSFAPDPPAERAELQRFAGSPALEDTLRSDPGLLGLDGRSTRRAPIPAGRDSRGGRRPRARPGRHPQGKQRWVVQQRCDRLAAERRADRVLPGARGARPRWGGALPDQPGGE